MVRVSLDCSLLVDTKNSLINSLHVDLDNFSMNPIKNKNPKKKNPNPNNYGGNRGGGDDGYAPFSAMLAIKAAQDQGVKMPRICLDLETEGESGSPNLISLLKIAKESIGVPDACFCMDSGAFDYNQLWITSSLRGICILDMTVEIGKAGYHSGEVGGIVPETFRVVRQLIDRLDDSATGKVTLKELQVEIPKWKEDEAEFMVNLAGDEIYKKYAVVDGAGYVSQDNLKEMYLMN